MRKIVGCFLILAGCGADLDKNPRQIESSNANELVARARCVKGLEPVDQFRRIANKRASNLNSLGENK